MSAPPGHSAPSRRRGDTAAFFVATPIAKTVATKTSFVRNTKRPPFLPVVTWSAGVPLLLRLLPRRHRLPGERRRVHVRLCSVRRREIRQRCRSHVLRYVRRWDLLGLSRRDGMQPMRRGELWKRRRGIRLRRLPRRDLLGLAGRDGMQPVRRRDLQQRPRGVRLRRVSRRDLLGLAGRNCLLWQQQQQQQRW